MAQSEQSKLVHSLLGKGYSVKQIAQATGRTSRYITLARDSETKVGKSGKTTSGKGQNLVPALKAINEQGKAGTAPERRKTKSGAIAKVRKGVREFTTKMGVKQTVVTVKKGSATIKKSMSDAAAANKRVSWRIHVKKLKNYPDRPPAPGWISGHLPPGWNTQKLNDRIANPESGDDWKAGDINGALLAIALEQNKKIISAKGADEYNFYTAD